MAYKPYQERVDQFLADYADKFIPTLVTGKGTKESPYTNMAGPQANPLSKEQLDLEKTKIIANSVSPDTFNKVMETMRGERAIPSHEVFTGRGTKENPFTNLSGPSFFNTAEGSKYLSERATAIPHVSTGFKPPTGMGTLEEIRTAIPNELLRGAPTVGGETERAVPSLESMYGIKREGNVFTLPGGEGTMTVGPERFFVGGKEVPAGTPGAISGDEMARQRILREAAAGGSAIPLSAMGESAIPMAGRFGGGMVAGPSGAPTFEMPADISNALDRIGRTLANTEATWRNPLTGKDEPLTSRMRENLREQAQNLMEFTTARNAFAKNIYEIQSELPYKASMADYYRRMAGVHEAALPSEIFARYASGMTALSESEKPVAFPPGSAIYQGAKSLGYVPEKKEAIHPIIRDIINKSQIIDQTTGQASGFDIRGARQKIGYIAPWLKAQGIEVPKESYKMTKKEFLAEQRAFMKTLPAKERKRYTPQYTEELWKEYWGD